MKDWEKLEDMTLWDITTNEGALTQLVVGMTMIFLSAMYSYVAIYYKAKYVLIKRRFK